MFERLGPAARMAEFADAIVEFLEFDSHLFLEVIKEKDFFLTKTPEKYYKTPDDVERAMLRFEDYFIYTYTSKHYQMKPIEVFLSKAFSHYSQKDQDILKRFKENIFGTFRAIDAVPGAYFIAKEVISGKEYRVRENNIANLVLKGDCFIGRLLPYEQDYTLSIVSMFLPELPLNPTKSIYSFFPGEFPYKTDPLQLEHMFFQHGLGNIEYGTSPIIEISSKTEVNLEVIEKELEKFLKKQLGKKAPSIKSLRKKFNRTTNPTSLLQELTQKMHISSQKELMDFHQLFFNFWNNTPRDEFQGKSPEQIIKESRGPRENELVEDFMNHMKKNMDITKFSDIDALEKAIKEMMRKWLHEPQEKLVGKTPFQTIEEEKEKMHSPRKDFPNSFNINPIELKSYDPFNLTDVNEKDSPVAEDVETFVNYFQENRIKVTPKNRWIPFKHLKLIEKDFVNSRKDSFIFLDKEEKWGEEREKPYIHFIHLLSRAEKLIYHDKKGYVQVNHKHFKKFTQNNYGEKTIKLLLDWIEKVNWVKLQATEYTTFCAQDYQKNIINIWDHHFYQLKANEKKSLSALTKEMYWEPSMGQEEISEIAKDLSLNVQNILLKYLKWFGVIDTMEKLIFPDLGIYSIKQFWVTPKGKKLINRVLIEFWKKDKIKTNK